MTTDLRLLEVDVDTAPTNGQVPTYNSTTGNWEPATPPGSGGGEANTASNVGAGGVGLYDAKVGVDLQFRNINTTNSLLTVSHDAGNKEVDLTVNQSAFSTARAFFFGAM